jgi:hypothetical protein
MDATTPGGIDEEAPEVMVVGLVMIAVVGMSVLGIGLGLAGVLHVGRLRTFGILGLVFNMLVLVGLVGLMVVGLMLEA